MYTFTGKRKDSYTELTWMGSRFYAPALARWIQPDSIVPDPNNPQTLNRYSYVNNRPLNLIDPSGHDPLDPDWQTAFTQAYGRNPTSEDVAIRLFSLAYPDEWDASKFYAPNGTINQDNFAAIFSSPSGNRSWKSMPDALARLAGSYKPFETSMFVSDVGTLFAGLTDRLHASAAVALYGGQSQVNVHLNGDGLPSNLNAGNDADANVHHWAAFFMLGYYATRPVGVGPIGLYYPGGAGCAMAGNAAREVQQALTTNANHELATDDIQLGNLGAQSGSGLGGLNIITPDIIRFWYTWPMIGPMMGPIN